MSGAKHTPGPWSRREAPYGWDIFNNEMPKWVAYATKTVEDGSQPVYPTRAESAANADLIAAAPELLEALEIAMEWIKGWDAGFLFDDEWPADEAKIKAAIARAKGGAA